MIEEGVGVREEIWSDGGGVRGEGGVRFEGREIRSE